MSQTFIIENDILCQVEGRFKHRIYHLSNLIQISFNVPCEQSQFSSPTRGRGQFLRGRGNFLRGRGKLALLAG